MGKFKTLYRVIPKEKVKFYKEDPSKITKLRGSEFKKFEKCKDFVYDSTKKYIHFFDSRAMAKIYCQISEEKYGEHEIVKFVFDEDYLKDHRVPCLFGTGLNGMNEEWDEYIIPFEDYDPKINFVGVLTSDENKPYPNVYALIDKKEVEFYATDLEKANGFEYKKERALAGVFKDISDRAIHLYRSKEKVGKLKKNYYDLISEPISSYKGYARFDAIERYSLNNKIYEDSMMIIPFWVDEDELSKWVIPAEGYENQYLVPLSVLKEENYIEEGKGSCGASAKGDKGEGSTFFNGIKIY